jgi:hypothetical protein
MRTTVAFAVLLTLLASPTLANGQLDKGPTEVRRQILLRLQDEASRVTTLTVADGGTGTYTGSGLATLALTPTILPGTTDTVSLSVSLTGESAVPNLVQTETLSPGGAVHIESGGYVLDVTWAGTVLLGEQPQPLNGNPLNECCVVCEGIKTCACKVQASCGSCTAPNCNNSCTTTSLDVR